MRTNSIGVMKIFVLVFFYEVVCYEKTLRKIVRHQSKMVQRPFSEAVHTFNNNLHSQLRDFLMFPGYAPVKGIVHKMQRPKVSTILSSVDTGRGKQTFSRKKHNKNADNELRLARDTFYNTSDPFSMPRNNVLFPDYDSPIVKNISESGEVMFEEIGRISSSGIDTSYYNVEVKRNRVDNSTELKSINNRSSLDSEVRRNTIINKLDVNVTQAIPVDDMDFEGADFLIETAVNSISNHSLSKSVSTYYCIDMPQTPSDINVQEKFFEFDIEPAWIANRHFWNKVYDNRYEFLMRNPNWPSLKVILVPITHVDTIWKKPFHSYYKENVQKIITNMIKKLLFYPNMTFTWNEVSHLSHWWKSASQKRRVSVRRLLREGRLEITTGGWVETEEATSSLFGLLHQFIEGHQWLHHHLNYQPKVAWLTKSVSHSPTLPYILSASEIFNLVFTNVHFAFEQFFAEYQYSDFMWIQNWDNNRNAQSELNKILHKIGKDRYPKHTVMTHYLQFNSGGFEACGPKSDVCVKDFNFADKILDINTYNVKVKSETLLEQYSKTGTTSPHNIVMAPIGDYFHYDTQTEFDYQYNNYLKISDFINTNQNIYKATMQFGTPSDYFTALTNTHKSYYPTLKGDFYNFADIRQGNAAYWAGFYTTRPSLKILLRRLQSSLRSAEILFAFSSSLNVLRGNTTKIYDKLCNVREIVARLQDRHVVGATLPATMIRYVQNKILAAVKDCWYIQEVTASLLSSKPENEEKYLFKYVYRDGEFVSSFKSVASGDHLYVFNSLSHERSELIELITRNPNIRIVDHNKKDVIIQINPYWNYNSEDNVVHISQQFYKIVFIINVPPMTMELFKVKDTYDVALSIPVVFCLTCTAEQISGINNNYVFNVQPIEKGDIQIENYKYRLIFDEHSGFLKTLFEKESSLEKHVAINYAAFRSSDKNSGIFLFNTNASNIIYNIFNKSREVKGNKLIFIVSGNVATDFVSIHGRLLQHSVQIYNILDSPLSNIIRIDSKLDLEAPPRNRELEIFMSLQTDISNGNYPEIYIDNNGFQYTPRILNISRRAESNMYVVTSMAFIQDEKQRMTIVTDHAQGITALQEGQILLMLDRRVLFNDGRGVGEGLADSSYTHHVHYIIMENLISHRDVTEKITTQGSISWPSILAIHIANNANFPLDLFFIDRNLSDLCYYAFLPLVQNAFPCDVTVINFRVLDKKTYLNKNIPNAALLILHRQGYSCEIPYSDLFYCSNDVNFNIDKVFQHVSKVYRTNLVGTSVGNAITNINLINFPAMELMTLKIDFSIQ